MRRLLVIVLSGVVALGIGGVGAWALARQSYAVTVVLDSASNLVEGGVVTVNGFQAGNIEQVSVRDGKAQVKLGIDPGYAPLHDGASVTVGWKATLGERQVEIKDGSARNAELPNGGMIQGRMQQPVELDQVLNALDAPTRDRLRALVNDANDTVKGHEPDLNATLHSAGPALNALGQVLQGVGSDGPAIKSLALRMNDMVSILARRDVDVRGVVDDLTNVTAATAKERQQLSTSLNELPQTMQKANKTLGSVPDTTNKAVPLLHDLQPATAQLPSVSRNLRPVLQDARPLVHELRPTLGSAQVLLQSTPGLLDSAHGTLPQVDQAVNYLQPALNFLRPYTPETVGFLSTWASFFSNYDSNGHYGRIHIDANGTSAYVNPGVVPPGMHSDPYPVPGAAGGQPWTDAFGGGIR